MEVWDLLRPSLRRLTVLAVAVVVAAGGAVLVEHARAAQYEGRVSVYFAQALGLDTTSNSVDPAADQLTSVFQLPSVEAKAAAAGGVPLPIVHAATLSHTAGSPIIEITAKGSQQEATKAAPALAAAGLEYFAQQGVARAQSVQTSATADLATVNAELAAFTARAGVQDVDAAVATAAAAAAAALPGTALARAVAANLARLRALQPQFDLLTTEVQGARTSVSGAYSAVGAAQGVAKAVELPGNVVTAPVAPASRITAYLRAAVGAAVVVVVLGVAYAAVVELRRRRSSGAPPAPAAGAAAPPPASTRADAPPELAPAAAPAAPPVLAGDFPVLAPADAGVVYQPAAEPAAPPPPSAEAQPPRHVAPPEAPSKAPTPPQVAAPMAPPAPVASAPPPSAPDPYLAQARRFVREQQRLAAAVREAEAEEARRRAVRDALQRVDRAGDGTPERLPQRAPFDPRKADIPPETDDAPTADVRPLFRGRGRAQIRVLKAVPDPVEDGPENQANAGC